VNRLLRREYPIDHQDSRCQLLSDSAKEQGFALLSHFHADCYRSVAKSKMTVVVPMKYVNSTYMKNKNHPLFNEIIGACEHHKIYDVMEIRYPWNEDVILQFYSTLYLPRQSNEIHWMTNGGEVPLQRQGVCPTPPPYSLIVSIRGSYMTVIP
jgi:hypothetical protein